MSACGQGRHVEHAANRGAPAPDRTFAAEAAAVTVKGSPPDQCGDLLAIDLTQLRQLGQERGGRDGSDPRHAPQAIHFVFPVVVRFDQGQDLLLELIDLFAEHDDHLLNARANGLRGARVLAVGLGSLQLDQLASADHQLLEFGGFLRDLSDGPRLRLLGVAREDVGIDPIGLGEDPQTACEVTDLTRIGDCHLVPRVHQLSDHGSLIAPGGFHNDPTRPRRGQRLRQLCQALFVVGESQETHQQALEQMQRNQQNVRSVYEARERIEESQKHQKEAGGMAELGAQYAGRFKEFGAGHVATERELQERDKKYASADRSFAADQYAKKFKEKGTEHAEAAKLAGETDKKNKQPRGSQGGASQLASDGSQGRTYMGPVDLQEQVLREEKAVKLANEMRDLARDRSAELQSQLAAMDQQVRAAEHQVAATREQLKVEQERELSEKARMSMMSKEDQRTATEIFKKIAQGKKIDRSDALFLQQRNLLSGSLGHKASDRLAEDLDPEFVKWRKAAGGEEGLEKAQEHLAESTHELADEQKKAKQTLQEYMETLGQFAASADTAMQAQKQVEDTKSRKEGYSNPEDLRPGEKRHHTASAVEMMKTIQRDAHADFLGAINEFVETTVTQFKKHAAHVREVKQRLNRAHDQ